MPLAIQAALWGLLSGSALVFGAAVGYLFRPPQRVIAAVMAFGAGVLISALSFELMDEAYRSGGFLPSAAGFLIGAGTFTGANIWLAASGARHRKRSGHQQPARDSAGLALALGALIDGVPESIAIGVGLLAGGKVSLVAVAAVFLSNLPEGLSSAAGMRRAGRSPAYVFGVWGSIALASSIAAYIGCAAFAAAPTELVAGILAVAAGAILAMIADTMMPEAFEVARDFAGLITVLGFLAAFALSKLSG